MRLTPALPVCAAFALLSFACDGRGGRPGGPQNPRITRPDGGVHSDATDREEDSGEDSDGGPNDRGEEPSRDAESSPDFGFPDFGFQDATHPDAIAFDAGFPDAFTLDAAPPRDTGVGMDAFVPDFGFPPVNDAGPVDSGPQLQTTISISSAQLSLLGSDTEYSATFHYNNVGPGSETILVTHAEVGWVMGVLQTFTIAPPLHVATVGATQRSVATAPGSQTPAIDPLFAQFICALGITTVYLEFSNGQVLNELTPLQCTP